MRTITRTALVPLLALAFVAAACGSDDEGGSGATTTAGGATTTAAGATTTAGGATTTGATTTAAGPKEVKTDKGVDDEEIRIGVLNGFTGPIAQLAIPAGDGFKAYVEYANSQGGACGRKLVANLQDTKYDPQVATQVYRGVKDDIVMLGQLVGAATIFGLSKDIERDGIATLAATGAVNAFLLPNVYGFITPFTFELINGMGYALENYAGDDGQLKVGLISQADAFGDEGVKALNYVTKNEPKVQQVAAATYAAADEDFTAQVQKMKDAGAEVVWLQAIASKLPKILGAAQQLNYQPKWMGVNASYATALAKPLGELLNSYTPMSGQASYGEDVEGMDTVMEWYKKVSPNGVADNQVVLGWISAAVSTAAVKRACELGDLTQAGVLKAMDGLEVDLEGISPALVYGASGEGKVPSRAARANKVNLETTFLEGLTPFEESELAKKWTVADAS